jgi:transposase
MSGCENHVGWKMRTGLSGAVRRPGSVASSGIPRRVSCDSCAGEKPTCGTWGRRERSFYDRKTRRVRDLSWGDPRVDLEFEVRRVSCRSGDAVTQENPPWWANNPFDTKRFAFYVGRRCRSATLLDGAREPRLDWKTVPSLEMESRREQLRRAGTPGPTVIGIDEISIGRGHHDRIVVSDRVRGRPIWCGAAARSEKSLDLLFRWLGPRQCRGIRRAVRDMGKPFRPSTLTAGNAPPAGLLDDTFPILNHLNDAWDTVRKSEYARLSGQDRRFITGQKYPLQSRWANRSQEGRESLKARFTANRSLNTASLLTEMFGQLGDSKREGWARRFFERGKSALRWQRLKPYERFARRIEEHWDGIALYCREENQVPLGFVEGITNKMRVIPRRASGLRDEESLRLKILTCMLPEI